MCVRVCSVSVCACVCVCECVVCVCAYVWTHLGRLLQRLIQRIGALAGAVLDGVEAGVVVVDERAESLGVVSFRHEVQQRRPGLVEPVQDRLVVRDVLLQELPGRGANSRQDTEQHEEDGGGHRHDEKHDAVGRY